MITVERNVLIHAPVDVIFRHLKEPTNFRELCPNLIELNEVQHETPNLVQFMWTYKMVGVRFMGQGEVRQIAHHKRLMYRLWGGINAVMNLTFQPVNAGVSLIAQLDYATPKPLLRGYLEETIVEQNCYSLERLLTALKSRLETQTAVH